MPIFLGILAIVLLAAAIRGKLSTPNKDGLLDLLKGDFTGQNNFVIWTAAILGIGAVGYFKPLQPVANAFLALVVLVLLLSHQGFFQQFQAALATTQTAK